MALKFLNVLKANAEIARLQSELDAANLRVKELTEAEPEALKALQDELGNANAALTDAKAEAAKVSGLLSEIETLKAEAVKLKASVDAEASAKAQAIVAAQGVPAIPAKPAEVSDPVEALKSISDPVKRAEFIRKNRSALFAAANNK